LEQFFDISMFLTISMISTIASSLGPLSTEIKHTPRLVGIELDQMYLEFRGCGANARYWAATDVQKKTINVCLSG
jgi:hypothetical protein